MIGDWELRDSAHFRTNALEINAERDKETLPLCDHDHQPGSAIAFENAASVSIIRVRWWSSD